MSSTNNNELDEIVKTLYIGQKLGAYKNICTIFNEKPKNGKSRTLQMENWNRYVKLKEIRYNARKIEYEIEEIYDSPIPKVDNRGKSEGTQEAKTIYAKYIDNLILLYLINKIDKNKPTTIHTTLNVLAESIGIVNKNYRTALSNQAKFYNVVKEDFGISTNVYAMLDSFYLIKTKIREVISSSLRRLINNNIIKDCAYDYFIYCGYTRPATLEESNLIKALEETTRTHIGRTKQQIDNNQKLLKKFNDSLLKYVQFKLPYIQNIFKGYLITVAETFVDDFHKLDIDMKYFDKSKLNQLIFNTIITKPNEYQIKYKEKEKLHKWFGHRNPSWSKWTFDRMSNKYTQHCENFIKILVQLDQKNISEEIVNCSNNVLVDTITRDFKKAQEDKVMWELIDKLGFDQE